MAKKKEIRTSQMNVRIPTATLKAARQVAKKTKTRLGLLVDKALSELILTQA